MELPSVIKVMITRALVQVCRRPPFISLWMNENKIKNKCIVLCTRHQAKCSRSGLPNRSFYGDGNVLCLCVQCGHQEPQVAIEHLQCMTEGLKF